VRTVRNRAAFVARRSPQGRYSNGRTLAGAFLSITPATHAFLHHTTPIAMNHSIVSGIGALVLLLVLTTPVLAQQRGQGRNAEARLFDPATVERVSGVITRVDSVDSRRGPSTGIHLQLQANGDTLAVHLGPRWYMEEQAFAPQANDSLSVRGSRVTVQGAPAIIAAEVRHGARALRLRDAQGRPAWRGQ